ncbi:hypothetical protein [Nostoc sp.]|uniref:hypothetical protein n=1 Tax=Nostoc sp. TaxID=1180 RepID=UPI002FF476FE
MIDKLLFLQIEIFIESFEAGKYHHPLFLAMTLECLANQAWDEVDRLYPNL